VEIAFTADGTRRDGYNEGMRWDLADLGTTLGIGPINPGTDSFMLRATVLAATNGATINPGLFLAAGPATTSRRGAGWYVIDHVAQTCFGVYSASATTAITLGAAANFGLPLDLIYTEDLVCVGAPPVATPTATGGYLSAANPLAGFLLGFNNNAAAGATTVEMRFEAARLTIPGGLGFAQVLALSNLLPTLKKPL